MKYRCKIWLSSVLMAFLLCLLCPIRMEAATVYQDAIGGSSMLNAAVIRPDVVQRIKVTEEDQWFVVYNNSGERWTAFSAVRTSEVARSDDRGIDISTQLLKAGEKSANIGESVRLYRKGIAQYIKLRHLEDGERMYIVVETNGPAVGQELELTVTQFADEPNEVENIGAKETFSLNQTVSGNLPYWKHGYYPNRLTDDTDCFQFRTGSNTIYDFYMEMESTGGGGDAVIWKDGEKVIFPTASGGTCVPPLTGGKHYYLPLEPYSDYQIVVTGTGADYRFRIGGFSLNDAVKHFRLLKQSDGGHTVICESTEYSGQPIEPKVHTELANPISIVSQLEQGTDYTVSYTNNILPGTATVTLTGMGDITGSVSTTFQITGSAPTTIKSGKVTYKVTGQTSGSLSVAYQKYSGTASSAKIPATVSVDGVSYKVTSVASNAFKNNKKVKSVSIGANVTSIGSNAFSGCTKLATVTGGSKLTSVGKNAFYGCVKLTQVGSTKNAVTLSKVKTIGDNAFYGCKNIKKVNITSTALTKIGASAFRGCTALTSFTEKSTKLSSIGKQAFYGDKKLATITLKTTKLTKSNVKTNAFKGIKSTCKFKVPSSKVKSYKTIFKARGAGNKIKVTK